jgi:hypothetical protein
MTIPICEEERKRRGRGEKHASRQGAKLAKEGKGLET